MTSGTRTVELSACDETATMEGARESTLPRAPRGTAAAAEGRVVAGRYRLRAPLGSGGHGTVFEAEDELSGDLVAVKLLGDAFTHQPARVRREIAALRLLRLPGVVRLLDEGLDQDSAFLVMELVDGRPFPGAEPPKAGGAPPTMAGRGAGGPAAGAEAPPRPWSELAGTTIALLETLARVHAAGVVHRDLKPGNVIVTEGGRPMLLDFGISSFYSPVAERITPSNLVIGTPDYLAPEQMRGDPVTPRTDLYTLGVMLYEALSGRLPHQVANWRELLRVRLTQPAPPLAGVAPEVPAGVARVVDKLLAIQPADRPRSAAAVLGMLQGAPDLASPTAPRFRMGTEPFDEAALRALFAGPERILHLQEDAARALMARTDGRPDRVNEELTAWVRAGLARWEGDRLAIDRDAIDRLDAGLRIAAPGHGPERQLEPRLLDLLGWIELAAGHAELGLLARAMNQPSEQVAAGIAELAALGAARSTTGGYVSARVEALEHWSEERQHAAHRALAAALPSGAPERLFHLIGGSDPTRPDDAAQIAAAAGDLGRRLAAEGQLGKAALALAEGLRVARSAEGGAGGAIEPLLELWVEIGLAENSSGALDRVLYEIHRAEPQTPAIEHLVQLVRAALALLNNPGKQALAAATEVPPFARVALEQQRQALRVRASWLCSEEVQENVLDDAAAWAGDSKDPGARAALARWGAYLRYRQGRYDEAATLYGEAVVGAAWMTERIGDALGAASSLMEAFRHDEAAAWASSARDLARGCRHAFTEARAEWILRATAYRSAQRMSPDLELVDAIAHVGVAGLEAAVALTEAAVALRSGDAILVVPLAERARKIWVRTGREWPAFLARCVEAAGGAHAAPDEVRWLAARALVCPVVGFGIQALGLLSRADPSLAVKRADLDRLAEEIPRERWELRMDVLSVAEVLEEVRVS